MWCYNDACISVFITNVLIFFLSNECIFFTMCSFLILGILSCQARNDPLCHGEDSSGLDSGLPPLRTGHIILGAADRKEPRAGWGVLRWVLLHLALPAFCFGSRVFLAVFIRGFLQHQYLPQHPSEETRQQERIQFSKVRGCCKSVRRENTHERPNLLELDAQEEKSSRRREVLGERQSVNAVRPALTSKAGQEDC